MKTLALCLAVLFTTSALAADPPNPGGSIEHPWLLAGFTAAAAGGVAYGFSGKPSTSKRVIGIVSGIELLYATDILFLGGPRRFAFSFASRPEPSFNVAIQFGG